jgi:hypothetical protein
MVMAFPFLASALLTTLPLTSSALELGNNFLTVGGLPTSSAFANSVAEPIIVFLPYFLESEHLRCFAPLFCEGRRMVPQIG